MKVRAQSQNRIQASRQRKSADCAASQRRGISTVWLILALPVLFVMFIFLTDYANIVRARVELQAAVDAGALAGANYLTSTTGHLDKARSAALTYTEANTVIGKHVQITDNFGVGTNSNATTTGNIVIGTYSSNGDGTFTFTPSIAVPAAATSGAVLVRASFSVNSFWKSTLGFKTAVYHVQAQAVARPTQVPPTGSAPELINIL